MEFVLEDIQYLSVNGQANMFMIYSHRIQERKINLLCHCQKPTTKFKYSCLVNIFKIKFEIFTVTFVKPNPRNHWKFSVLLKL